ncbi:MAG: NADH-quinone oxidoreductase subunit NuoE [Thermodesulfobacteriota bacterium]
MLPNPIRERLVSAIQKSPHPRELVVDVLYALQRHYGYLSDQAVLEAAELLDMSVIEIEELATFYDYIYREPVGKYVIHACDSIVCWMQGYESVMQYLSTKLGIPVGGTTADGLFSLLPAGCIGYCDHAPAMLINGEPFGPLTPETIDAILDRLRREQPVIGEVR